MTSSLFSIRSLLYLTYAVLLTAVFLYVRFPAEKFKSFCESHIEQLLPGSDCKIERISYQFPLSAALEAIKISGDIDGQPSQVTVDRLTATPAPLKFWRSFSIVGEMYSGRFAADFDLDRTKQSFQLTKIRLEDFEADQLATSVGIRDKISGTFSFSGDYKALTSAPADGTGQGQVRVEKGTMKLLQPILALQTVDFEKIEASVNRQDGRIIFSEGQLQGGDLSADFKGEMRLASPWANSNILLSGSLRPDAEYLRKNPRQQQLVQRLMQRYKVTVLPFKVGGTVKRPLFRFSK